MVYCWALIVYEWFINGIQIVYEWSMNGIYRSIVMG